MCLIKNSSQIETVGNWSNNAKNTRILLGVNSCIKYQIWFLRPEASILRFFLDISFIKWVHCNNMIHCFPKMTCNSIVLILLKFPKKEKKSPKSLGFWCFYNGWVHYETVCILGRMFWYLPDGFSTWLPGKNPPLNTSTDPQLSTMIHSNRK